MTKMIIDSAGNVGIGTEAHHSPEKLDVNGSILSRGISAQAVK